MATRSSFIINSPWTTQSLSAGFQQAFTAAGFGTYHDDFVSGSFRNSILKVTYDGTKALGSAYHWFMFGGQEVFLSTATGWNAVTHVPTGTQYRDFITATTSASTGHYRLAELNSNADTVITVWRSTVNTNFSWFLVKNGTTTFNFHIPRTSPREDFIDAALDYYHPFLFARAARENKAGSITIARIPVRLRSTGFGGESMRNCTQLSDYGVNNFNTLPWSINTRDVMAVFNFPGLTNNTSDFDRSQYQRPGMILPIRDPSNNSYYTTGKSPIFHSLRLLQYAEHFFPSDFGPAAYYGLPNVGVFDQYVNGTQRWDVIEAPANVANPVDDDSATPLFLARTVPET